MTAGFRRLVAEDASPLSAMDVAAQVPGPAHDGRPFVLVNMIATVDGRATIAGRTGPIANPADHELFHALRTRVDAVMVGAETVRVEGYGRTVPDAAGRAARERAGLRRDPLAVVVTRSVALPAEVGLLATEHNTVVVLTTSTDAMLPDCAAEVHYLRGELAEGVRRLASEFGVRSVLCEGGPALLGALLRESLVDELHLVVAPMLAAGQDPLTIVSGEPLDPPRGLRLLSAHEAGGYLFLRYASAGVTANRQTANTMFL